MAELARTDDMLEKQLETLFSDTVLSPLIREDQRRVQSTAAAAPPSSRSSAVSIPQPAGRPRLLKPKRLTSPRWIVGILAGLAVVLVAAIVLLEPMNLTRPANTVLSPPWSQPTGQVRTTAGSLAYRSPQTLTPSRRFATPTKSIPIVTILPVARQSIQPSPTPASSPSPAAGGQYEPVNTAEPTGTAATEGKADLARATTPNPTASAVGEAETPRPLPSSAGITATAPKAKPVTDLESAYTPTKTSGVEPMSTYQPGPTATIITREAQPTATFAPTSMPPPAALAPSSPTRILIPAINLEAPIITVGFENYAIDGQPVTTWAVPAYFAVGWHHTSALPGKAGNTVLNGHQNIHGGVFRNLAALQRNDEIIVYTNGAAHYYHVVEQHILKEEGQPLEVRAENARWIMSTPDERLTLVTCAPSTANSDRLIVVALPDQPPSPIETPFLP
jgi:LPXTG-site transpeptidase (sortase) family protein